MPANDSWAILVTGKYRGQDIRNVNTGYLMFCLRKVPRMFTPDQIRHLCTTFNLSNVDDAIRAAAMNMEFVPAVLGETDVRKLLPGVIDRWHKNIETIFIDRNTCMDRVEAIMVIHAELIREMTEAGIILFPDDRPERRTVDFGDD